MGGLGDAVGTTCSGGQERRCELVNKVCKYLCLDYFLLYEFCVRFSVDYLCIIYAHIVLI